MILFFNKKTGRIFATIDGRVHNEGHLSVKINDGKLKDDEIGKYVIGWIENKNKKVASNIDKLPIVEDWEDVTPTSPLDYKIDVKYNKLVKVKK